VEFRTAGAAPPLDRRSLLRAAAGLGLTASMPRLTRAAPARQGATPVATPVGGGTAVVAMPDEPPDLFPWQSAPWPAADILDGVMDGLLRFNADGALIPALAESFDISDDGLTYTFPLRPGATFHSGEPFSAADVIACWRALRDPALPTPPPGWDRVANVDADQGGATLRVTTAEPYAPLLSTVATTPICPASAFADGLDAFLDRFAAAPVGTGPFRVKAWTRGERIELARHAGWWGGTTPLDGVTFRFIADRTDAAEAMRRGEIDVALGTGGDWDGPGDPLADLAQIAVARQPTRSWLHLDLKQLDFLREKPVRQALDFAVPRNRILTNLLHGRGIPAAADQSPANWAYAADLAPRPHDPAQAAALLDGVGLTRNDAGVRERDGAPFVLEVWSVDGDARSGAIADAVAAAWRDLGVVVPRKAADPATLWGPLGYQFSDAMTACLYAWTNGNDPDDRYYWHSSQIPRSPSGRGGNLPAFFYPYAFQQQIDGLIDQGIGTFSLAKRQAIYGDIQHLLADEAPAIFLFWEEAFPAVGPRLQGCRPHPYGGLLWNAGSWRMA
jgi:peptide/nickel transport system substrate-binding protein